MIDEQQFSQIKHSSANSSKLLSTSFKKLREAACGILMEKSGQDTMAGQTINEYYSAS